MCAPIAGAVIAGLAAIGTAVQQADNQRRQVNYQDRVARATETSAANAADADYLAVAERISQVRQSVAQEAFAAGQEADRAQASLEAGAEFSGLQGGVVGDLRTTIAQQAADSVALRQRNASWEEQQIMRSMVNIQTQQQSRLNAAMPTPVPGVDYVGLLGNLGTAAVQGYAGTRPTANS